MRVEVHDRIADLKAADWNRLAGDRFPFLRHEFLHAGESSACVSPATGWQPRHIALYDPDGSLCAAMPLYEKTHSWGEFVFDWGWAQAYERAGLEYYPKLVSAAPFTPAPGSRLLHDAARPELAGELLRHALEFATTGDFSSLHILFPRAEEHAALKSAGLKLRKDCQFHWHNDNYSSFDDFLGKFSASKRKKARRDRRHVAEAGVRYRWLNGRQLDRSLLSDVYQLISITFMQRGSLPYYDLDFFTEISRTMPDNLLVILAERRSTPIAAAVFYRAPDALYGRYWGASEQINALHFETCYYQGIDYCIEHGLSTFEPGTQGEHKISRGFTPVSTWSAHWLARPEFLAAIERYLDEEQRHVNDYIDAVHAHTPFRADGTTE